MQEELQEIIKHLQERSFNVRLNQTKSIHQFNEQSNNILNFYQEENAKIHKKLQLMDETIQSLLEYGARMNKLYEQTINQGIINFNSLKEEKDQREHLLNEELFEAKVIQFHIQRIAQQLVQRIEQMKKQITYKQENQRTILEKYQELINRERQVSEHYEKGLLEAQKHFLEQIQQLKYIIQIKQHTLLKSIQQNQKDKFQKFKVQALNFVLSTENDDLKKKNQYLIETQLKLIETNRQLSKEITSLQEKIDDLLLMELKQKCDDAQSIRSDGKLAIEVNRPNQSKCIVNFNEEKQLLNLSQNYILSLQSFCVKFNQSQEHIDEGIVHRSRFIKNTIFKILQKEEQIAHQPIQRQKPNHSSQAKSIPTSNPYQSFFSLLVQSQKLNSPHFNKIAHMNISHLYNDFVEKTLPFNKWQEEIKKYLESKLIISNKCK